MGPIWILENLYLICLKKNLSFKTHLKKMDTRQAIKALETNQLPLYFTPQPVSKKLWVSAFWGILLFLKIRGFFGFKKGAFK